MKQPHTEGAVDHTDGEQDTGNHRAPAANPPTPGGTRIGADNVEPVETASKGSTGGTSVELESELDDSVSVNGPTEREAARDERGRL